MTTYEEKIRSRKPDMTAADKHIERARALVEHAKKMAIEEYPIGSDDLVRRTALSLLLTAFEISRGDCHYPLQITERSK